MWIIRRSFPAPPLPIPASGMLAAALAAVGVLVIALGIRSFRRARTTVNPLAPTRASALVKSGIYSYSRNPMYLGFSLLLTAWGVWLGSVLTLLVVPLFIAYMNRFQIMPEEQALESLFGSEYIRYQQEVRRWL